MIYPMPRRTLPISSLWFQGAILTYLAGFTILGVLAYLTYRISRRFRSVWLRRAAKLCSRGTTFLTG